MNPKHVREERQKDRMCDSTSSDPEVKIERKMSSYTPGIPGNSQLVADVSAPESQLTSFLCGLERQMEMLTDEDVRGHDDLCEWSRDISLPFGLLNPRLVIKRSPVSSFVYLLSSFLFSSHGNANGP